MNSASIVFAHFARAESASPFFKAGVPGVAASFLYSSSMAALERCSALDSSHWTFSASRPWMAAHVFSASTATP